LLSVTPAGSVDWSRSTRYVPALGTGILHLPSASDVASPTGAPSCVNALILTPATGASPFFNVPCNDSPSAQALVAPMPKESITQARKAVSMITALRKSAPRINGESGGVPTLGTAGS